MGIDYSPVMVEYARAALPGVDFRQEDARDLSVFAQASFDSVFATNNVLDALSHEDRLQALHEIRYVLRQDGILIFSSHNRRWADAQSGPRIEWSSSPVSTLRSSLRWFPRMRNYLRVKKLRRQEQDYALLNDIGHDYACLHYYIDDVTQRSQLQSCGFELLELLSNEGRAFLPGSRDTARYGWLLYVARAI